MLWTHDLLEYVFGLLSAQQTSIQLRMGHSNFFVELIQHIEEQLEEEPKPIGIGGKQTKKTDVAQPSNTLWPPTYPKSSIILPPPPHVTQKDKRKKDQHLDDIALPPCPLQGASAETLPSSIFYLLHVARAQTLFFSMFFHHVVW